jgi:glucose-6-phosphate isomerase
MRGDIVKSETRIADLKGFFEDEEARKAMRQDQTVYHVEAAMPEEEGTPGGLFFGASFILPGLVGDEYFMTKGHYHHNMERAEYYWCITGKGLLLLMDENRRIRTEEFSPGNLCYIPRRMAHRLVNTGDEVLTVGACWPSDAGHNYGEILSRGFAARVKKVKGSPKVVSAGDA